ncbi:hypothetical protein LJB42_003422 [Komagataella kurtzmanii]|nr:hypothetical protein LJB42_003422 [Komagataella kurtzmanii]
MFNVLLDLPKTFSVGIDGNFFSSENSPFQLKGIKLVEPGIHFIHLEDLNLNLRSGIWINGKDDHTIVIDIKDGISDLSVFIVNHMTREMIVKPSSDPEDVDYSIEIGKILDTMSENFPLMVNYSSLNTKHPHWESLTKYISFPRILDVLQGNNWFTFPISTLDASKQENEYLIDKLSKTSMEKNPDRIIQSLRKDDYQMIFSTIEFNKTARPNATPSQLTQDSVDKSWFVETKLLPGLLLEFQLSFLLFMILNNASAASHWVNIIKIMLNCDTLVEINKNLFIEFFDCLSIQLKIIPEELVASSDSMVNLQALKESLTTFNETIENPKVRRSFNRVKDTLKLQFQFEDIDFLDDI